MIASNAHGAGQPFPHEMFNVHGPTLTFLPVRSAIRAPANLAGEAFSSMGEIAPFGSAFHYGFPQVS
jgi:hypothetical protein